MKLRELEKRRLELLVKCSQADRNAGRAREIGRGLWPAEIDAFKWLTELRIVERNIAKLKEKEK